MEGEPGLSSLSQASGLSFRTLNNEKWCPEALLEQGLQFRTFMNIEVDISHILLTQSAG